MEYHDELLQHSVDLCHRDTVNPIQADLRRAVSGSYYALFHLLVSETIANWNRADSRLSLGRAFDHKPMKNASKRLVESSFVGEAPETVRTLKTVASTFSQLQEKRHTADYDNATFWTLTDALAQVKPAQRAFAAWKGVRDEQISQAYLVSLFVKTRD